MSNLNLTSYYKEIHADYINISEISSSKLKLSQHLIVVPFHIFLALNMEQFSDTSTKDLNFLNKYVKAIYNQNYEFIAFGLEYKASKVIKIIIKIISILTDVGYVIENENFFNKLYQKLFSSRKIGHEVTIKKEDDFTLIKINYDNTRINGT